MAVDRHKIEQGAKDGNRAKYRVNDQAAQRKRDKVDVLTKKCQWDRWDCLEYSHLCTLSHVRYTYPLHVYLNASQSTHEILTVIYIINNSEKCFNAKE